MKRVHAEELAKLNDELAKAKAAGAGAGEAASPMAAASSEDWVKVNGSKASNRRGGGVVGSGSDHMEDMLLEVSGWRGVCFSQGWVLGLIRRRGLS